MGLSWISPFYFLGMLLIAIPVLIHLVRKQRHTGFKFPSLFFLKKIPYKEKRHLEIRNWWLLILRCILLSLLVLAFARPFLADSTKNMALDTGRSDSVIVIDRSYSMSVSNHWQQTKDFALRIVDGKKSSDQTGIVMFDGKTEVLSDLSTDASTLRTVINRQSVGLGTTNLGAAVEQAARLLRNSDASEKIIHLISDFQATGISFGKVPRISKGITLNAIQVSSSISPNTAISAYSVSPSILKDKSEYGLKIQLNNGSTEIVDQQVKLNVNGRLLTSRNLRLDPGTVVDEHFDGLVAAGDYVRGVVQLKDDALLIDNRAFFVYSTRQVVPVLILEGSRPRDNQSLYLEKALRLSQQPVFKTKRLPINALTVDELKNWAVIIINDASIPGGELGQALKSFVSAGGGLLVAAGNAVQGNWPFESEGFLPGRLLRRVDLKPGVVHTIAELNAGHPLSNFLDGESRGDLSATNIFSYRNVQPSDRDNVLGRYSNGGVALLERIVGQGRVIVLTTTLDTYWNDLAVQPMFLPFIHNSLRYLAAFEPHPKGFEVDEIVDVERYARAMAGNDAVIAAADGSAIIVETPSGNEIRLNRQSPLLHLEEQGFYQVHRVTPTNIEVVLAANTNPIESNLELLDIKKFTDEVINQGISVIPGVSSSQQQLEIGEQQQQIWHIILAVVLLLMLIEAFSANRLSRKRTTSRF